MQHFNRNVVKFVGMIKFFKEFMIFLRKDKVDDV